MQSAPLTFCLEHPSNTVSTIIRLIGYGADKLPHIRVDLKRESGELNFASDRMSLDNLNAARAVAGFEPLALYQMEFPDFDPATLPTIPEGWTDTSWHNDSCPTWRTPEGVRVYVDYADPASRELDGPRFGVTVEETATRPALDRQTDDWATVLALVAIHADDAKAVREEVATAVEGVAHAVVKLLALYEAHEWLNECQPDGASDVYAGSLDEWAGALMTYAEAFRKG